MMKLRKLFTVLIGVWFIIYPEFCIAESTSTLSESARVCVTGDNGYDLDWLFVVQDDGTVYMNRQAMSRFPEVGNWTDIVAISSSGYHIVGLRDDGTVIATGENEDKECDVSDWENIIQIEAGISSTIGLCADGTVKIAGPSWKKKELNTVSKWKGIRYIESDFEVYGIDSDGHVVVSDGYINSKAFSKLENVTQIIADAPDFHFLTQDGNVLKFSIFGDETEPEKIINREYLHGAIQIAADTYGGIMALMPDGTIKSTSVDETSESWENIVAITDYAAIDSKGIIWFSNPNIADGKIISIHSN